MIARVVLVLALFCPALIAAQDYPALYDVTGVAADDTLNVRTGPGVSHPIIDELAPDETGIEIVGQSADGRWLQLNAGEQVGWAAARFLTRTGPDWAAGPPARLSCYGVEPFWGLEAVTTPGGISVYTRLGEEEERFATLWSGAPSGRPLNQIAMVMTGTMKSGITATAALRREMCSDGASDQLFGLSILLTLTDAEAPSALDGCCRLVP